MQKTEEQTVKLTQAATANNSLREETARLQAEASKLESKLKTLTAKLADETQKAAQAQNGWDRAQKICDNRSKQLTKLTQNHQFCKAEKGRVEELLETSQSRCAALECEVDTLKTLEAALSAMLEPAPTTGEPSACTGSEPTGNADTDGQLSEASTISDDSDTGADDGCKGYGQSDGADEVASDASNNSKDERSDSLTTRQKASAASQVHAPVTRSSC